MNKMLLIRCLFLIHILGGVTGNLMGQTTISQWTYEPLQGTTSNPTPNVGSGSSAIVGSMTVPTTGTGMNTVSGCGAQSTGTTAWAMTSGPGTSNESSGVQYNVSTVGFESVFVRWEQRWSNGAPNTVRFQYTTDGTNWTNFTMTSGNTTFCNGAINTGRFETNTTGDQYRRIQVDLSSISAANNNANFGFRVVAAHYQATGQFRTASNVNTVATGGTWRFDNVRVQGTALPPSLDPTVTITANLVPFNYILNEGPSTHQSFSVSGINLTNAIQISVPTGYEQSLSAAGPYQTASLNLIPSANTVSSTPIFIRLLSGQSANTYGGNISIVSDAPSSPNTIAITGQVISEVLPYAETFGLGAGTFPIGWTRSGAGANNWNVDLSSSSAPLGGGGANLAENGTIINQEAIITCNRSISTIGHSLVRVKFNARKTSSYSGSVIFEYSTNGSTWNAVTYTDVANNSEWGTVFFFLPLDAANVENLRVRFRTTRTSTSGNYRIDDFTLLPPGIEVNLSASTLLGLESNETEILITATTATPVLNNETITLAVTGSQISSKDYQLSSPSIFIPAGQSIGTVTFKVLNDNLNEALTENALIGFGSISFDLQPGSSVTVGIQDAGHDAIYLTQMSTPNATINFDELQNDGSNFFDITAGFYIFEDGINGNTLYRAANGSESTGDTYSFGSSLTTERALGSINTSPNFLTNNIGAKIVNNTGQTMNGLNVAYTGEQWRRGTATSDELRFSYSTDATSLSNGTWTEVASLHFVAPQNTGGAASLNGNLVANQVQLNAAIHGVNLPAGQTMWIRWRDLDVTNADHGMGIDNVVLTPFITTQLRPSNCGATNVSMDQVLGAINVNAPAYRFLINGPNNGGTGWNASSYVYTPPAGQRTFRFQFIPGCFWGAPYTVQVAVGDGNGNWGPYGNTCSVILATQTTTQIAAATCGNSVTSNQFVSADWAPGAAGYRFRISGANNGGTGWVNNMYEYVTTAPVRKFTFGANVPGAVFGATYSIDVAVLSSSNSWLPYGTPCSVTLLAPTTQIQTSQCGISDVLPTTSVNADQVAGASGYRFKFVGANSTNWVNNEFILDRPIRNFGFSQVTGSLQGEEYQVTVAVMDANGNYGAFGAMCTVTRFGVPEMPINENEMFVNNRTLEAITFDATASHNPFTTDFGIQVLNANDSETINVVIYDMSGKMIERQAVNPMGIENAKFGANLASGMYMIEVKQGSNQAVIRQVKN